MRPSTGSGQASRGAGRNFTKAGSEMTRPLLCAGVGRAYEVGQKGRAKMKVSKSHVVMGTVITSFVFHESVS